MGEVAGCASVPVEVAAVEGPPLSVDPLHHVRHEDVGVKLRVAVA